MLTLRQIEVIHAVMVTGTIAGAAKLLNVSSPGVSRLMKYTERAMKVRLFERRHGRYVPTTEASDIFEQINGVYKKVDDLQSTIARLERGETHELKIATVPSIGSVMAPRAIASLRRKFPDLRIDVNILKIEEAIDYLLLRKGEVVAISHRFDHPSIDFRSLATGELLCIVPDGHPFANKESVTPADIGRYPLIGIDPHDPYGRIIASIFVDAAVPYDLNITARFGTTVCALVKQGLGIGVVDQFTIAHEGVSGIRAIRISQKTTLETYAAVRNDAALSIFAEAFIDALRVEMRAVTPRTGSKSGQSKG